MNIEFLDKYSSSVSLLPCSEVLTDSSKNPSHSSNLWLVNKCKHLLNEDIKIFKKKTIIVRFSVVELASCQLEIHTWLVI